MKIQEAIQEIKSVHKWYAVTESIDKQNALRVQIKRIEQGTAKHKTIKQFLNTFGYEIEITTDVRKMR